MPLSAANPAFLCLPMNNGFFPPPHPSPLFFFLLQAQYVFCVLGTEFLNVI